MRRDWKKGKYTARKLLLIGGVLLATGLLWGCSGKSSQSAGEDTGVDGIRKYQRQDVVMGTNTTAVVYSRGEDRTGEVMDRISAVEQDYISWRVERSEIHKINESAGGEGMEASAATASYLEDILKLSEVSGGAFDPTMGKLTRLWDIGGENPRIPPETELESLLAESGYEKIGLDGDKVTLDEGASIDLGAVGKGIGCDEAKKILEEDEDITGAVISVGGSILVWGEKPDGSDWNVAITNPEDDKDYMGSLRLSGEYYVSTSGNYEKYFMQDGKRYHHILDPATGYPAESGLVSVSVVCDQGLLSDGLSTACFVLGREKSLKLLEHYDAEAVFVDEDHNVYVTDGIKDNFQIVREGYSYEGT